MASRASFTEGEWVQLLEGPMLAGMAVSAAEPSGLFGMIKESFATGSALAKAGAGTGANELVKAVAAGFATAEGRTAARDGLKARLGQGSPAELKAKALEGLRAVSALLAAKAPEDATAFKAWLGGIADDVAQAAKEGSVLGFGGTRVSAAEEATLQEIEAALA